MRNLLIATVLFAFGAPAFADAPASDTLKEVTSRGIVLNIQGTDIDIAYTPDGKFTGFDGQLSGTWRIDGEKLCTFSNVQPEETCTVYPKGKKSGDTFDLPAPQGAFISVKIK